jgi:hypothetical protein
VFLLAGGVLVVAAALKGHQFAHEPPAGGTGIAAVALIGSEFALGGWLLMGIAPAAARYAAIVCFSLFLLAAVEKAAAGEASCGCFGAVSVAPWATAILDLALVTALIALPPPPGAGTRRRAVVAAVLLTAAGAAGSWPLVLPEPDGPVVVTPRTIDFGRARRAERREADLAVTNRSGEEVELGEVTSTCPCLSVEFARPRVRPGETVPGKVVLDLSREPEFTGRLAITASGTASGRPAFQVTATVSVEE